jgi:hypothetical protein
MSRTRREEGKKEEGKTSAQKELSQSSKHFLHCRTFIRIKILLTLHAKIKHTLANEPSEVKGKVKLFLCMP